MYDIISKYCPEFGEVRTIRDEYGTIWYCATDIIRILGYNVNNSINVLHRHCRCLTSCKVPHPQSSDKTIEMNFINREDVFNLLNHSRMPKADEFRHWLFGEVLPTMEQTGTYILDEAKEEAQQDYKAFYEREEAIKSELRRTQKQMSYLKKELNEIENEHQTDSHRIRQQCDYYKEELLKTEIELEKQIDETYDYRHKYNNEAIKVIRMLQAAAANSQLVYQKDLNVFYHAKPDAVPLIKLNPDKKIEYKG